MLFCRSQNSKCQKKYRKAVLGEEKDAGLEGGQKKRRKKDDIKQLPEVSRVQVEEVNRSTSLAVDSWLNLLLYSGMWGSLSLLGLSLPSPVHQALVDLQLHTGVQVRFLSTWKDFTDFISMSTKAVAEAPFKWAESQYFHIHHFPKQLLLCGSLIYLFSGLCCFSLRRERENTGFTFCLESEWSGGHKVDRAGNGLLQVWKRQIQQLNRVSPDMASAILSVFPSPQLLAQVSTQKQTVTVLIILSHFKDILPHTNGTCSYITDVSHIIRYRCVRSRVSNVHFVHRRHTHGVKRSKKKLACWQTCWFAAERALHLQPAESARSFPSGCVFWWHHVMPISPLILLCRSFF